MGRSAEWVAAEAAAEAAALVEEVAADAAADAIAEEVAVEAEFRADDLDKRCFLAILPLDAPPIPKVPTKILVRPSDHNT